MSKKGGRSLASKRASLEDDDYVDDEVTGSVKVESFSFSRGREREKEFALSLSFHNQIKTRNECLFVLSCGGGGD